MRFYKRNNSNVKKSNNKDKNDSSNISNIDDNKSALMSDLFVLKLR